MKTICAWCGKVIKEDEENDKMISHGICEECKDRVEKEENLGP